MARSERKKRGKKKEKWMNNSKANTVETRRGLNICFAKGRQSTTGKKRNVHIQDGFYYIHTRTRERERERESWHIFSTTSYITTTLSLLVVEEKEKINFSLIRSSKMGIIRSIIQTVFLPWNTYLKLKKHGIEFVRRYWPYNVKSNQREEKKKSNAFDCLFSLSLSLYFLLLLCMCSSIRSWFFMRLLFTLPK